MATKIYKTKEIILQDDTEVLLRPLPIARLRRFMDAWSEFDKLPDGDDGLNILINCAGISLENNFKGKFDSMKANAEEREGGEHLSPEYKDYLEEVLDVDTIYEIMDVCGGIKLNDPKLLEAAIQMQENASGGKN